MPPVLAALAPIFVLIGFGAWLKWRRFPGDGFWLPLDRLIYFVLMPALLVHSFATADLSRYAVADIGLATVGSMLAMALLLALAQRFWKADGPAFSSVLQAAVRFNTYAGLAMAERLHGADGFTAFSLVIAFVIPTANVISVVGLIRYASAGRLRWGRIVVEVARNPLILGVLAGVALSVTGIGLPQPAEPLFAILAQAALPLALLAVGAGLEVASLRASGGILGAGIAIRLFGMPALALAAAALVGLPPVARTALLLYACLPVSPAAYVLARQLGGDAPLMASLITGTTLVSMATIPLWLALAG